MKAKTVSIIIPLYNEEQFIQTTLKKVISSNTLGLKKEIIIVDDASTDRSIDKIRAQIGKNNIILLSQSKNHGKGAAIQRGIIESKGDIVIVQDADLEYNPDDYPLLLSPFLHYDADVVYGSRFISHQPHRVLYFWHYAANILLTTFSNMFTNLNITDMETGYKAFNGYLIRALAPRLQSRRFGFEPEITARISKVPGIKIFEVGISYSGRTYAEGKKIGWKDGLHAIWEIIKYNLFVS